MEAPIMDSPCEDLLKDVINSDQHTELVNGVIKVENKTTVQHNLAVSSITMAFKNFITAKNGTCEVFSENVALYVNELCQDNKNYFLPDVMTVCKKDGIKDDGIHTTPLFVAEITSEATRKQDYCDKLDVYKKIGVSEYWIVDLQRQVIYKYLKEEDYIPQTFMHPESMKVSSYPGLMIDMALFMT